MLCTSWFAREAALNLIMRMYVLWDRPAVKMPSTQRCEYFFTHLNDGNEKTMRKHASNEVWPCKFFKYLSHATWGRSSDLNALLEICKTLISFIPDMISRLSTKDVWRPDFVFGQNIFIFQSRFHQWCGQRNLVSDFCCCCCWKKLAWWACLGCIDGTQDNKIDMPLQP